MIIPMIILRGLRWTWHCHDFHSNDNSNDNPDVNSNDNSDDNFKRSALDLAWPRFFIILLSVGGEAVLTR